MEAHFAWDEVETFESYIFDLTFKKEKSKMSYYYNYYAGYKKNGKIYPLGPFNSAGELVPIISRSRSFASDLYEDFRPMKDEVASEELKSKFGYTDYKGNFIFEAKYLSFKDLSDESFIKTGYFLIDEVSAYEQAIEKRCGFGEEFFSERLSPTVYSAMVTHENRLGKKKKNDEDENEDEDSYERTASDYMYYAYPDYSSKGYEIDRIKFVFYMLWTSEIECDDYVVLETEG